MKHYELFMYFKQGDDFAQHLEDQETNASAFRAWSQGFRRRQLHCEQIAKAIEGEDIDITADTHMIVFHPNTEKAEKVLELLAESKYISPSDLFDEEQEGEE